MLKKKTLLVPLFFISCAPSEKKPKVNLQTAPIINESTEIKNGEKKFYFPNGTLWSTSTYKDNIRHGKTTSYYENGQLRYLGFYDNGKKSGKWFFYNQDGAFVKEINYDSIKNTP